MTPGSYSDTRMEYYHEMYLRYLQKSEKCEEIALKFLKKYAWLKITLDFYEYIP
jgi:hypothetical protein